jgi:hypothetical protein
MAAGNLGGRPYAAAGRSANVHSPTLPVGFLCDAEAALAVFRGTRRGSRLDHNTRLKTLTFSVDKDLYRAAKPCWILRDSVDQADDEDRVCGLALAHPATSELEELYLTRKEWSCGFEYRPRLEYLSCGGTLRVLELKRCNLDPPTTAEARCKVMAFPSLTDLRLERCFVSEGYLQAVVNAATALAKLVLVNVKYTVAEKTDCAGRSSGSGDKSFGLGFRLRCPTVTALVLDTRCNERHEVLVKNGGIELDMPSLLSLNYRGFPVKLSLTAPSPELTRVELDTTYYDGDRVEHYEPTASMLTSLSSMRSLTLHMRCLDEIVTGQAGLPTFPNLNLLEINGENEYMNTDTQLAMARLLGSCPAMSELRLMLNNKPANRFYRKSKKDPPGGSFSVSMDRFKRLAYLANAQGGNGSGVSCEISEPAALSSCTFGCLRKVTLQFKANELDCFPVQLAKFLVENAMALKEMHVDDGVQFWTDHLYNNLARWRADSFRRKNLKDTGGFRVYKSASA